MRVKFGEHPGLFLFLTFGGTSGPLPLRRLSRAFGEEGAGLATSPACVVFSLRGD